MNSPLFIKREENVIFLKYCENGDIFDFLLRYPDKFIHNEKLNRTIAHKILD
jgi:hypothetical protein